MAFSYSDFNSYWFNLVFFNILIDNFSNAKAQREKKMREICEREGILDDYGYNPHHCFFRSEYKKDDYDEPWNIEPLFHTRHTGGRTSVHGGNRKLDVELKRKALGRYTGKYRDVLEKILKKASYEIE